MRSEAFVGRFARIVAFEENPAVLRVTGDEDRTTQSLRRRAMSRALTCAMRLPGGTLRVNQTLPPMVEPGPIVTRPRIVAPA